MAGDDGVIGIILDEVGDSSRDFAYSGIGILVNLMTEAEVKRHFLEQRGFERCLGLLDAANEADDFSTASLVCQLLWNFFAENDLAREIIRGDAMDALEEILVNMLDPPQEEQNQRQVSDEFSMVALHLINKLFPSEVNVD